MSHCPFDDVRENLDWTQIWTADGPVQPGKDVFYRTSCDISGLLKDQWRRRVSTVSLFTYILLRSDVAAAQMLLFTYFIDNQSSICLTKDRKKNWSPLKLRETF